MSRTRKDAATIVLRVVLGIVVLAQSFAFLFVGDSAKLFARHGLPDVIRLTLGWCEVVAAILFLLPPTLVLGAWSLLVVFAVAIFLHLAHGQFEVGGLAVYSAAVLVVLVSHEPRRAKIDASVA